MTALSLAALAAAALAVAIAVGVVWRVMLVWRLLAAVIRRVDEPPAGDERVETLVQRLDQVDLLVGGIAGRVDQLAVTVDETVARVADLRRPRQPVELSDEQRQELAARWLEAVCGYCGLAHSGACPRVRTMTTETGVDPHGRPVRTVTHVDFWPNDQWSPPENAISAEDVWGPGSVSTSRS